MAIRLDTNELATFGAHVGGAGHAVQTGAHVALARTAHAIEHDAEALCPTDARDVMHSISTTVDGLTAEVGPTADDARAVELGTSRGPARPFLAPAFDHRLPEYVEALSRLGTEVI